MKFKEADLVRAFESLDSDPAADAARVLAAIPTVVPVSKPLWPIITMAALSGAAISALLTWMVLPTSEPSEAFEKEEDDPPPIEEMEELIPPKFEELLRPPDLATDLALEMSIGEINVLNATSSAPLRAGHRLAYGQTYETSDDSIVQIDLGGVALARLGPATRLVFEDDRIINLISGLLWLQISPTGTSIYVVTNEGDVEAEAGSVISLSAHDEEVRLAILMGNASFDTISSGKLRLRDSQFCLSIGGLVEDPKDSESAWYYFRWQIPLLTRYEQNDEIIDVLATLSRDLVDPKRRESANEEFRRLGSFGPLALARALEGMAEQGDLRHTVMSLFCDIADRNSIDLLLNLLLSRDGAERALAAETMRRVSGIASGKDEEFWRNAPFSDRDRVRQDWRRRLNKER